jgi:hypothetical protein
MSTSGYLGPSVETVILHTINLKNIDKKFSKEFTIGFGNSNSLSDKKQSEFLGFVYYIVSKIETSVPREISTLFKYKGYCCLYYQMSGEKKMFMVNSTNGEKMEYFFVVPKGDDITSKGMDFIQPLFDKVETITSTPASSSKNLLTTPGPGSSSKISPTTPGTPGTPGTPVSLKLFTPGGTATAGYTPLKYNNGAV